MAAPEAGLRRRDETATRRPSNRCLMKPAMAAAQTLPAARRDAQGRVRVDLRAVLALALPLFLNASIQAVLNLTDTWFVGRISATAVAAVGSVYWVLLGTIYLVGGIGFAVQTFAAQAYGARRYRRAAHAAWSGAWAALVFAPLFLLLAWGGAPFLPALGYGEPITGLAIAYWTPRIGGASLALLLWSQQSFFNGIGHVRTTIAINLVVALANVVLNEWLIFGLDLGVAGAAWATNASIALGAGIAIAHMLCSREYRERFGSRRVWRARRRTIVAMITVGLPIGVMIAFDLLGLAMFQLMMTRIGVVDAAATQIVMMLTSVAYMPAVGLGMAGTTLVGQSIGAGSPAWAWKVGNRVIAMTTVYMGLTGIVLGALGPTVLPAFVAASDPLSGAVATLAATLLWIAACYQFFDGLHLGAAFCLRGAGDTRFPAATLLALSVGVFVPLTHVLSFDATDGLVRGVPGLGGGAVGGWWAAVTYVVLLGLAVVARWGSRRWMGMRLRS